VKPVIVDERLYVFGFCALRHRKILTNAKYNSLLVLVAFLESVAITNFLLKHSSAFLDLSVYSAPTVISCRRYRRMLRNNHLWFSRNLHQHFGKL